MKPGNQIQSSILQTLFFFNLFDQPLNREEIFENLWRPPKATFWEFLQSLEAMQNEGAIQCTHGFYHLTGKYTQVSERLKKGKIWEKKISIARVACQILRFIPFVRAVFVCNTVASGSFKESSDIDVFIIIQKQRLWLGRLLVTLALGAARLRRHGQKVASRICLSFFIADDYLDLAKVSLGNEDIYLNYWINQLLPLYDPHKLQASINMANTWTYLNTPNKNTHNALISAYQIKDSALSLRVKDFSQAILSGPLGTFLEKLTKKSQNYYMLRHHTLKRRAKNGVIISDSILKCHENDRRQFFYEQWKTRSGKT